MLDFKIENTILTILNLNNLEIRIPQWKSRKEKEKRENYIAILINPNHLSTRH